MNGTICQRLIEHAERDPKLDFASIDGSGKIYQQMTYGEFCQQSDALAAELAGYGEGSRVLILCLPGIHTLQAMVACFLAKVIAVPIPYPFGSALFQRLNSVVRDCDPKAVIVPDAKFAKMAYRLAIGAKCPALLTKKWLVAEKHRTPLDWQRPKFTEDDIAYLQYTSGSTGEPKGCVIRHKHLYANVAWGYDLCGSRPYEAYLNWLPLFHDYGLVCSFFGVFCGGRVLQMSALDVVKDPWIWLKMMSEHRVGYSGGPPFIYDRAVDKVASERVKELDLSHWKYATIGGEKLFPKTVETFAEHFAPGGFNRLTLQQCLGMAEGTLCVTGVAEDEHLVCRKIKINESEEVEAVGCGKPAPNSEVIIVDRQSGSKLPKEQIGEICFYSPSLCDGYWQSPFRVGEELIEIDDKQFYRTGDLGTFFDEELYVVGRIKDTINVRGRQVFSEDLERAAIEGCAEIRAGGIACFTLQRQSGEEVAIAFELANVDAAKDEIVEQVRRALNEKASVLPTNIVATKLRSIPRTSSGKIRRHHCRDLWQTGKLESKILWHWQAPTEGA